MGFSRTVGSTTQSKMLMSIIKWIFALIAPFGGGQFMPEPAASGGAPAAVNQLVLRARIETPLLDQCWSRRVCASRQYIVCMAGGST